MFRVLCYCKACLIAGFIGMLAGMIGQVYIYEFSDRNDVLMQASNVFRELDELSFMVSITAALVFLYFCAVLEYRHWNRLKKRDEAMKKV